MKKNILFLLTCSAFHFSIAQSLLPAVISSSGNSFNDGVSQLDFTIGEVATAPFINGSNNLTQGFHQPDLLITSITTSETNYLINIFPNPTTEVLQLNFEDLKEIVIIELFSVEGKLLQTQQVSAAVNIRINMSEYSSGTYLLSIKDTSSKVKTYQIIKTK